MTDSVKKYILMCLIVFLTHESSFFLNFINGYYIYAFLGSLSLLAISLMLKFCFISKKSNILVISLCVLELFAILLQLVACYANLTKEVNWFYNNFRFILSSLFYTQIYLLLLAGTYGLTTMVRTLYLRLSSNRSDTSYKSFIYPLFYERRERAR